MNNDHGGGGGGRTDVSMVPFDLHPASSGELEEVAGRLEGLAGHGLDLRATTDQQFQPAQASWDGLAAAELQQAPVGVRADAAKTGDAMAWLAGALWYWRSQVDQFNTRVGGLEGERAEARTNRWGIPTGEGFAHELVLAQQEHDRQMRERWWAAHQQFIDEGSRTAAAMLSDGPTAENLELLAGAGVWRDPAGAVALLMPRWHDQAMQGLAGEMAELAERFNDPYYQPTPEELARLAEVLGRYADDEAFAYHFLSELGPEGLLTLTGSMATMQVDSYDDDGDLDLAATVGAIQTGLGVALATATTRRGTGGDHPYSPYRPGQYELDSDWRADLMLAGRSVMPIGDPQSPMRYGEVYGYQLLGVLLHSGDYDEHFLGLVGGDMIDFEMSQGNTDFWIDQTAGENFRLDWITTDGTDDLAPAGYDPMIGLMSALDRNPEGALAVFAGVKTFGTTPEHTTIEPPDGYRLPRLDYLLTDREWREDVVGGPGYTTALWENEDDYVNPGLVRLGAVLESAAGLDDDRAVQLVESIVYELNVDEQAMGYRNGDEVGDGQTRGSVENDLMHPALRGSVANIMADYIWDVNRAMSPGGSATPGGRGAEFSNLHMLRTLADLGREDATYDTVAGAQAVYTAASYDFYLSGQANLDPDGLDGRLNAAHQVAARHGAVMGTLDYGANNGEILDQDQRDTRDNAEVRSRFAVAGFIVDEVTGRTVGAVPIVGGPASGFISGVLDQAEQAAQQNNSGLVTNTVAETLQDGRQSAAHMAEAALYHSGQLPSLPPELVGADGSPRPMSEWTEQDHGAWQNYKDTTGHGTVAPLEGNAAGAYDDGADRANASLNRDVFDN
jgi:hypothetical protein